MHEDFLREIEDLAERDGRYKKEAYLFIYEALEHTVKRTHKSALSQDQRHVSGRDLLYGISEYGMSQFGPLTSSVFAHWGVHTTQDFGEIVFNLVKSSLMSKTDEDCIDDFIDVYDFEIEFDWKSRRGEFKKRS